MADETLDTVADESATAVAPNSVSEQGPNTLETIETKLDHVIELLSSKPDPESHDEQDESEGDDSSPHDDDDRRDESPDRGPWTHYRIHAKS